MAWQIVLCVAFFALAIISIRLYAQNRTRLSQYLVIMFCAISFVETWATIWLIVGPPDRGALGFQIGSRSVYLLLVLYPWALYMFAAKVSDQRAKLGRILATIPVVPLAAFLVLAPYPVPPVPASYQPVIQGLMIAITLQFLITSGFAAFLLRSAARSQPTIVSNRLRMMGFAAVLLTVALIIGQFGGSAATRSTLVEWIFGVSALAAAIAFYLCLAPPRVLRVYWSYSAVQTVRTVMREILQAASREEAVELALPIMAEVAGSERIEAFDTEGNLLATWNKHADGFAHDAQFAKEIVLPMESEGRIVLQTSALWPFVGVEETDLLTYVASSVGLALNRRKLDEANAQIRVQSAVERSLRVQAKDLERVNRELNEFVAVASHDLQTPVRNIIDNIEFLNEDLDASTTLNHEARQDLHYIESGAYRIKHLIDGLLHYTRIDAAGNAEMEEIDLNEIVTQAKLSLGPELSAAKATVTVEPLPDAVGNHSELGEVLVNILANSCKYRSPQRALQIRISATTSTSSTVEILISDNGMGIEPEFRERVFEMFKRLHRHEDIPGTGIGLAVCRKIVERCGGQIIFIEPAFGQGSTVKLILPSAASQSLRSVA